MVPNKNFKIILKYAWNQRKTRIETSFQLELGEFVKRAAHIDEKMDCSPSNYAKSLKHWKLCPVVSHYSSQDEKYIKNVNS